MMKHRSEFSTKNASLLAGIILSLAFQSCARIKTLKRLTSNDVSTGGTTGVTKVTGNFRQPISGNSSTGFTVTTPVAAGTTYPYYFSVDGAKATIASCRTSLGSYTTIEDSIVWVRIAPNAAGGTETVECTSTAGQTFELSIPYLASKLEIVSEMPRTAAMIGNNGPQQPNIRSVSRDGAKVAANSLTPLNEAILIVKNADTREAYPASFRSDRTTYNTGGNAASPLVSDSGRYVCFQANTTTLIPGVTGNQIYLKDMETHAITLISADASGNAGTGGTPTNCAIDATDTYVYFVTTQQDIVGALATAQIVRKTIATGAVELISKNGSGATADAAVQGVFVLSENGTYLFFSTASTNLVAGVTGTQIYRKHLVSGAVELVSEDASGADGNGASLLSDASVSADGRYAAFVSASSNWGQAAGAVYRKDLQTGTLAVVSSDATGATVTNGFSPSISADGSRVYFATTTTLLVPGASGRQAYAKTVASGAIEVVSKTQAGTQTNAGSFTDTPIESKDGRFVFFLSTANNLDARFRVAYWAGRRYIYRKSRANGSLELLTDDHPSIANNDGSFFPWMTADAKYVSFYTLATNLIDDPVGYDQIVVVKNRETGEIKLASGLADGTIGYATGGASVVSEDGRYVVFTSDFVYQGGVAGKQMWRKDLTTGAIAVVSADAGGTARGISDQRAGLSSDGRYVLFVSASTFYDPAAHASGSLFRKDMQTGAVVHVSEDAVGATVSAATSTFWLTPVGSFLPGNEKVLFLSGDGRTYVKDLNSAALTIVDSSSAAVTGNASSEHPALSRDGVYATFKSAATNLVAGVTTPQIYRKNLNTGAIDVVTSNASGTGVGAGAFINGWAPLSDDGRYVVMRVSSADLNGTAGWQIYRKDMQTGAVEVANIGDNGLAGGGTYGDCHFISGDGREVTFVSGSGAVYLKGARDEFYGMETVIVRDMSL